MMLRSLLAASILFAASQTAGAACVFGNSAISPCVQTYGIPKPEVRDISPKLRSDDTRLRVGRPEIHDRMLNDNRPFMSRKKVDENIFFSGSDANGNLVMGTCVGGRCR